MELWLEFELFELFPLSVYRRALKEEGGVLSAGSIFSPSKLRLGVVYSTSRMNIQHRIRM